MLKKVAQINFFFLVIGFVCLPFCKIQGQSFIQGHFHMDTTWERKVYLSYVPTFNDMYTMTNNMIIAESEIDQSGKFSISTGYLPTEDNLYRVHISKRGDPPASLIIGGIDQNHFFIVAKRSSDFFIKNQDKKSLFQHILIERSEASKSLQYIDHLLSYMDSSSFGGSIIKKEFITNAIYEKLRVFADTCSHPLTSLYAIYCSKFESNYSINQQFYENYIAKWDDEKSTYFQAFKAQIPISNDNEWRNSIFIGAIAFILGFFIHYLIGNSSRSLKIKLPPLSIQERKIFSLIQMGKSNQEISDEYSISLSTVKTHVSNIYTKLNINSRKEAIDIKL